MKIRRLPLLLMFMCVLALLRWRDADLFNPSPERSAGLSQAVERPVRSDPAGQRRVLNAALAGSAPRPGEADRLLSRAPDRPANAFAIRITSAAQAVAALPPGPIAPVVSVPPQIVAPQAPPTPNLSVIGTWDDPGNRGAFVSTPNGVRLVKPGDVLMKDYHVTALTDRQLVIEHQGNKSEYRFALPRATRR